MAKQPKNIAYLKKLHKQYNKIIAETTDKEHKKVTKAALRIVQSKIKELSK